MLLSLLYSLAPPTRPCLMLNSLFSLSSAPYGPSPPPRPGGGEPGESGPWA
ncbi:hypothetical protein WMY93_033656, partial [Mugilogobius chulae]